MKKRTKRFDDGGMTDQDVASFAGTPENDSNAGMAEAYKEPETKTRGLSVSSKSEEPSVAKAPIVSKKQLQDFQDKHGADKTLRDYMNAQKGLTRRGESQTPNKSTPVKTIRPSAAPAPATPAPAKAAYETPYDRMNRQNREASAAKEATAEETRRLANRVPPRGRGVINTSNLDSNTLLPKRSGFSKGGSVSKASSRADGIAQRGKTKGRMI